MRTAIAAARLQISAEKLDSTMPTRIAVAVVENEGRILIGLRPADVVLAGLWEFPGGKVEPAETPAAAAARECLEETGLAVTVLDEYETVDQQYAHGDVELHFFRCRLKSPGHSPAARFRWVPATELPRYNFPAANAAIVARLASSTAC
jgi:8-oxo-dGTP diphosphatase